MRHHASQLHIVVTRHVAPHPGVGGQYDEETAEVYPNILLESKDVYIGTEGDWP